MVWENSGGCWEGEGKESEMGGEGERGWGFAFFLILSPPPPRFFSFCTIRPAPIPASTRIAIQHPFRFGGWISVCFFCGGGGEWQMAKLRWEDGERDKRGGGRDQRTKGNGNGSGVKRGKGNGKEKERKYGGRRGKGKRGKKGKYLLDSSPQSLFPLPSSPFSPVCCYP